MKYRPLVAMIAVFVVFVLIFSLLLASAYRKIDEYEQTKEQAYEKALSELDSSVNSISLLLNKVKYSASSSVMSSFATKLYSESQVAQKALAELSDENTTTLKKFLSGVSNYALSVSKSVIKGEGLSEGQQQSLMILAETSKTVADVISSVDSADKKENWTQSVESALSSSKSSAVVDKIYELEEKITDFATLAYEGAYSEHIISSRAIFLENKPTVSLQDAKTELELLGIKKENFEYTGDVGSDFKCYGFSFENAFVAVTKNGGYPIYYLKEREVKESKIDDEKALKKAEEILEKVGYKNMSDTYYYTDNGVCVINFVFLDGQTLCYTDLIKVGIALDDGELLFLEATGYIYNHTERAFKTPTYTKEQAKEKLNQNLKVKDIKVALIPTDELAEKRCYEFLCEGDNGQEILVYINVNSLEEEQIFILIKDRNGVRLK